LRRQRRYVDGKRCSGHCGDHSGTEWLSIEK
jgi:hypothetical protein